MLITLETLGGIARSRPSLGAIQTRINPASLPKRPHFGFERSYLYANYLVGAPPPSSDNTQLSPNTPRSKTAPSSGASSAAYLVVHPGFDENGWRAAAAEHTGDLICTVCKEPTTLPASRPHRATDLNSRICKVCAAVKLALWRHAQKDPDIAKAFNRKSEEEKAEYMRTVNRKRSGECTARTRRMTSGTPRGPSNSTATVATTLRSKRSG